MSATPERMPAAAAIDAHRRVNEVPKPALSVWDATMITVGIVIGVGIFQTPALVANTAGSATAMLLAWTLGGVLSLIGALTYVELATTYPSAGGDYTFLTRAYGRNVSFLFAWARGLVIVTGSIALLAFILGEYMTRLWSLGTYSAAIYAAAAVLLLTALNFLGLRSSARVQNILTIVEIGCVLLVAFAAATLEPSQSSAPVAAAGDGTGAGAFGLAMVFVLLTFGGWNESAYVSAEVRGGPRSMLKALVLSIAIITAVYLCFVCAVLYGLGFDQLSRTEAIGIHVMQLALGPAGAQLIGAAVAVCALTSINSTMIVGARTNYSLARDWPAFAFMDRWEGERNLPVTGLLIQAGISLALIAFGATEKDGFATLVEFTAPVFWFFFMLSGLSLLVMRRKDPAAHRPFRVPFYPVLPLIFVATCAYLLYSSILHAQSRNAGFVALSVMATGMVVLLCLRVFAGNKGREGARSI
jgi:basic amino acid/polyamine antiporter, APA family